MGVFSAGQKAVADSVYESSKQYLRKQNGLTHVICYYLSSQLNMAVASCENKLSDQINQIIVAMQKDGYEILDVKITPLYQKDFISGTRAYMVMVMYK